MKINQVWIEKAIIALQDQKIVIENEFAGEYKGYISSFGAAIIQSGLLPAVIFYENSPSSNKDKNFPIISFRIGLKVQEFLPM